jgi:CheY-like chemotaxis protein
MAKIVVLEDDASTRRLVSALLKKFGHEVIDVDNGAEGLLTVMAEQPDLVISDVEMPKMNGFEVLSDIRHAPETADTPVILLTSLSSRADMRKGMSQGADDYITKPFEPAELMESVQAQLMRLSTRRVQAGLPPVETAPPAQASAEPEDFRSSFMPERDDEPLSGFASTSAGELLESLPGLDFFPSLDDEILAPLAAPPAPAPAPQWPTQRLPKAWAVHMSVLNEEPLQSALPTKVWRSLLRELFLPVSRDADLSAADYLGLVDSQITLYFVDRNDGQGAATAARAVQAMVRASVGCRRWAAEIFRGLGVPGPRIAIGLHMGPIDVVRKPLDSGGERDVVEGATPQLLSRLREGEPKVMWRVLATEHALRYSPGLYRLGANMEVSVGNQDVVVYAVQGVAAELAEGSGVEPSHWI